MTPLISQHARERCEEMGISTKVAKRIAQNPSLVLPDFQGHPQRRFVHSCDEPGYAIVLHKGEERDAVITVLYYTDEYFTRPQKTGRP